MDTNTILEGRSGGAGGYLQLLSTLFAALLVESFLYGIHLVLFCICFYILFTRRNPAQIVVLLAIIVMFALATADIALSYHVLIRDLPMILTLKLDVNAMLSHIRLKNPICVTNNLIADCLLLYRCFVVWGGKKKIILAAAVLLVADSVWGYLSRTTPVGAGAVAFTPVGTLGVTFTPVYYWSVFTCNVVMTIATAGRIWWLAHTARALLGKPHIRRYNTAAAVIIESGAIYSLSILLVLLIPLSKNYRFIFLLSAIRIGGIMPTLMIVQVELGRNSDHKRDGPAVLNGAASFNHTYPPTISDGDRPGWRIQESLR